MADKKGKRVESGQTPMDNSDTDYDVLSISSRCVSSDDNDLKGSWYGVGQLDDDTDDPECIMFSNDGDQESASSPPLSPQSLKMPTLAFSIDSLSESTPTPSKYFFKDDLKLEWDVVTHKTPRSPPRYRDGHNLPPLGAPVDRVCLLNLCGTPSPAVQKFFVHYYGFKTEVEMLNLANIDKLEFHPATCYVGFITLTSEESISSALLKVDAALNARARGIYVTCWAPSQLSTTSLINASVYTALKPLQDTSVLSFPLAVDAFDPLDIQLIEWEEHSVRRKRSSTLMFQFNQKTVWKAIVGFLVLAITAQISQYFLLYSIGDVNIVSPEIAPAVSPAEKVSAVTLGTTSSATVVPRLLTKKCCMEKAHSNSVIIVPPSPLETNPTGPDHCTLKQQHAEQQRLMPSPHKATIDEEKPKSWAKMDMKPMKEAIWKTLKRAQRHKLVQFTRSRGLEFRQQVEDAHLPERVQKAVSQCVSAQASFQTSVGSAVHNRYNRLKDDMAEVDVSQTVLHLRKKVSQRLGSLERDFKARINYGDIIRRAQTNVPIVRAKYASLWSDACKRTSRWATKAERSVEEILSRTHNDMHSWREHLKQARERVMGRKIPSMERLKGWWSPKLPDSWGRFDIWTFWSPPPIKKPQEEQSAWAKLLDHKWKLGWSKE